MYNYFLCILVVVCQNISGLSCRLKLTGIEPVCLVSILYLYSLHGICEGIRESHRMKNQEQCEGKNTALFYTIPNSEVALRVFLSWLMPSFQSASQIPAWWSDQSLLHSTYCFRVKGFCKVGKCQVEGQLLFNTFLLYSLQDHVYGSPVCAESGFCLRKSSARVDSLLQYELNTFPGIERSDTSYSSCHNLVCLLDIEITLFTSSRCRRPVGWGCRIRRLNLCRGVRPHPPMRPPVGHGWSIRH